MYYIAGLTVPVPPQAVEGLAVFATLRLFQYGFSRVRGSIAVAKAESGAIRASPTTFIGKVVTPIHLLTSSIPSATYALCVTANKFTQPAWMQRMSLSNDYFTNETKVALRIAACASTFVLVRFAGQVLAYLGNQWHVIGRREKPRLVQTGPYAVVRHPLYTLMLIQQVVSAVMFWSYVPLVGLGIVSGALAVKMPIEEGLIMKDPAIAAEYWAYMQKVPARVIPFLW